LTREIAKAPSGFDGLLFLYPEDKAAPTEKPELALGNGNLNEMGYCGASAIGSGRTAGRNFIVV
jgi:hypothetical protein